MDSLFEEAKMLYNNHRENITYENLRGIGYSTFEADGVLKYLSLLRVSGKFNIYHIRVFDENSEVNSDFISETTESRAKSIMETRCKLYDIKYTRMTIKKL